MQVTFTMTESTTLAELLALRLYRVDDEVHRVVDKAVKEMAIEKVLSEISQTWTRMEFTYEIHDCTSIPLLKPDDELIDTLEDNQVQLQLILQSTHVDHFLSEVSDWQRRLTVADAVLRVWLEVQRTWAHLERIFMGSGDISQQLPDHTHRFQDIDADFKKLMFESAKTKNVIEVTSKHFFYDTLEDLQTRLALCEKALAQYLETKRLLFPRFYFVSSADSLDMLSKGSRPEEVTRHLPKLFDSIAGLQFLRRQESERTNIAQGMLSKEQEYVPFQNPCHCIGAVEVWLSHLEDCMRETVRRRVAEAVASYEEKPREQWVQEQPAQVALLGSQIWWSTDVGIAFQKVEEGFESALKDYHKKQIIQLNSLINMLLGELLPGDRQKIRTICTIDVHARDVVSKLLAQKVTSAQAFSWSCQLRHRWDEELRHCFANICDAQFLYSYEYLGNTPRLVITPLTDRCYITLTQSLHLTMSGAPTGPAGTGKTETTKDLGKALGVMVYVFNCSEQMDYKSIGNIYKGLAQTGAWGCFDEFNRIPVEVLSVVAVQVKTIQDALRKQKRRFLFLEEEIPLKPSVGIFITMNPGYAGRTELPENLKALFRPCAMVLPEIELICEIMLVAEGFQTAQPLARKFIKLYKLCQELLSKQDHYDWGLRAIKSVLMVAGMLKREDKTRPEAQVLMCALRDFNLPKIITDDVHIFMGLIGDLFPAVAVERKRDLEFEKMVIQASLDLCLQPEETFILKVVQLEELLAVHHSVFVVGNAGTGKSKILRTLHKTYINLQRKPVWDDLNPKVLSTDELFGLIDPVTREWKDGLLSCLMREQANISHPRPKWMVLDGDIDPMWIESLNTVMDDNKVLTLASNERVPLTPSMRLLFEVGHLSVATPATVSRAGVLYVNPQDLGWNPYVVSWIDSRTHQSEKANLTILFDKYIPRCLDVLKGAFRTVTLVTENSMVQTLCALLDCLLSPENVPPDSPRELYEVYFTFASIWAFGGALCQDQLHDYRAEFSQWWTKEMKSVKFPAQGTVFDYYIDPVTKKFLPWNDKVPKFEMEAKTPLQDVLVHTVETVRLGYFMDLLLGRAQPLMLVGNAGVGKTTMVGKKMDDLSESYMVAKAAFNYYTTSAMLQKVLEKPLEKKTGRRYGPPGKRKLIYVIDDMNMPAADSYGTVQPHSLIRQHLDYGHWYDRHKLSLKEVHSCQYVACMNPSSGNFTVNPRLQRHFSVFAVNFPSSDALERIYGQILDVHFQQNPFSPAVLAQVVQAALWLHHRMVQNFLPTAVKFHYTFNLRDLSSTFQGMLLSTADSLKYRTDLVQLWLHESSRVYSDKLLEPRDHELFGKLLSEAALKHFEGLEDHMVLREPLIYCHFSQGPGKHHYMPVKDWATLRSILTEALESYNELHATMNLVLFEDAMQHVCRISRVLESPRGHALLVGVGGSGKQSLVRLAAYLSSVSVFQVTLHKGYSLQDLKTDLASLYIKTGTKNIPTVLLLTDTQIPEEHFLVPVSDLLASGELPDLFSDEEVDQILAEVRNEVRGLGLLDSRENCWRFFVDRVRRQLKVVLCFSPVGTALRVRARRFPPLFSCTTIDWFHEWPPAALQSVSRRFLQEMDGIEPHIQESISRFMAYAHTSVNQASEKYRRNEKRYNYTTPKSFLQQITLYRNLLGKKREELACRMERVVNGLQKLQTTTSQVDNLKAKLSSQEVELNSKNQDAEALIGKIGYQTEIVSNKRETVDEEERKVTAMQAEVSLKRKDCETELAKAEPSLEAASAALDTLNKVNLTELKSFPNPPAAVSNVMGAVMVLLAPQGRAPRGRVPRDRSWKAARVFMGKADDFLQALMSYDKEHIPEACLKVVKEEYLSNPEFHPDLVRTKSFAAAGLCAWTINIVRYYEVYCEVAPKRQALSQANSELEVATAKLTTIRKKLLDLDANLRSLTARFEKASAEKLHCQEEVRRSSLTMELANRLVEGLQSENARWTEAVEQFEAQQKTLSGDVLLATAFVSYLGYFTRPYRQELLQNSWIPFLTSLKDPIPLTDGLDPILILMDDATMAAWSSEGLPSDRMSLENGAILANCERWPLMIDPQQQGIEWVRNWSGPDLRVVQLGQKGYLDTIEQAMATGAKVLIENLGEMIDPILDPLLARNTIKKGRYIQLAGKECEYNRGFQLLLHTKLPAPHYSPELQAHTTLINFTVTQAGLEDQLLRKVVTQERPDLETQKCAVTAQQNHFKIELKELEDELLTRISAAEGSFLDDTVLVEKLEDTKQTVTNIESKVAEAKENETEINAMRELYRPAAERASLLFFIIRSLHRINPMYQLSLKTFNGVFLKAIEQAERAEEVAERVFNLTEAITYSVFLYTSRGLFERDKLTFLSHMTFQILLKNGSIDAQQLHFLLSFPVESSSASPVNFLSPQAWGAIKTIASLDEFRGLDRDVEGSAKPWRKLVESEWPEKERFPHDWKTKTLVQKLVILRALRPDRMTYALRNFVEESLGSRYVNAPRTEFEKSFEETNPASPVLFILSPGVNPLKDVETLGQKMGYSIDHGRLHSLSLGQGQDEIAGRILERASRDGHWVILQNIHLVAQWLNTLEELLEKTGEGSHPDYRVFISAEPAGTPEEHIIPQGILENAIKITNEPPSGMQANLHAALCNFNQEMLEMSSREREFNGILFSLCFFHACVTERRKFGPLGWNHAYPFSTGDLTISADVLHNCLEINSKVPWEDLHYLFGEIMYGGHITDDWDRRLCQTYLQEYMQPSMFEGELSLCPGFLAPPNLDYSDYHNYVDKHLPAENPTLYGLHSNAETEYLTSTSNALFRTLMELQPGDHALGDTGGQSEDDKVKSVLDDILEKLPEEFNMLEIMAKSTERSPYVLVCLQECERMNLLIGEIFRSLKELNMGLKGQLTVSPKMEALQLPLSCNNVPESWTKLAYPSTLTLAQWFKDLLSRCQELDVWTQDLTLPPVVWLSGFFNPQSFLTAVMQSIARKNTWPLDKVRLTVDVTKKFKDDYGHPPREGAYIHGLYMEGARWDIQNGTIADALPKELTPQMPVLYLRAAPFDQPEPGDTYECPLYKTKRRGPTYVWTFPLRTRDPSAKWILAGAALLLSV
ncbi:dynein axonemal heavy chain 11 isoform X2 [Paramormyrops kingsleyae]|uniref:dynein axonemal heavy chain 11 isoform X2 n=1 Tax=Paramormyrops kingsleyae TaxID=1676925 RepID=UPI003B97B206